MKILDHMHDSQMGEYLLTGKIQEDGRLHIYFPSSPAPIIFTPGQEFAISLASPASHPVPLHIIIERGARGDPRL